MRSELPPSWNSSTLGAVCKAGGGSIQTGPFGSQLHASDYVAVGVPSVMPKNIGDNRIDTQDIARVRQEDAERLSRHRLRAGDVVYSRRGDVRRRALVREKETGWLCGTGCLRVRLGLRSTLDPEFLSYYLGARAVGDWIERHAVGATMLNLNTGILSAVPVVVPPMQEQRRIASLLRALDEQIAVNRRTNQRVAELGYWLVEALQRRHDCRTAPLSSIATLRRDAVEAGSDLSYIGLDQMPRGSTVLEEWLVAGGPEGQALAFDDGDILFGKLRPYFRKGGVALTAGRCSSEILVLRPVEDAYYALLLHTIASEAFVDHCVAVSSGTRMPRSEWPVASTYECYVPQSAQGLALLAQVSQAVRGMYRAIQTRVIENQRLEALRNELLPRLIFGQVRVSEDYEPGQALDTGALVAA